MPSVQVHSRAAATLRAADVSIWQEAMGQLLSPTANPAAASCLQRFVHLVGQHPAWVHLLLGSDLPNREVRRGQPCARPRAPVAHLLTHLPASLLHAHAP